MKSIREDFNTAFWIQHLRFVPDSCVPEFPRSRRRVLDTIAAYGLVRGITIHMAARRDLRTRVVEDIHILIPFVLPNFPSHSDPFTALIISRSISRALPTLLPSESLRHLATSALLSPTSHNPKDTRQCRQTFQYPRPGYLLSPAMYGTYRCRPSCFDPTDFHLKVAYG
jgi:hypothetical protein